MSDPMETRNYAEILGPTVHYWIAQLHDRLTYLAETRGMDVVYGGKAARGIDTLMRVYAPAPTFDAAVSNITPLAVCRIASARPASFRAGYEATAAIVAPQTLADLCQRFLGADWDRADPDCQALSRLTQPFALSSFRALIAANDKPSRFFRGKLEAEHVALDQWLASTPGHDNGHVFVDAAADGLTLRTLRAVYPGQFPVGLSFFLTDDAEDQFAVGGVAHALDPNDRETVFALHPQLAETVLQPESPVFAALRDYVTAHRTLGADEVLRRYRASLPQVFDLLATPTAEDAETIGGHALLAEKPEGGAATFFASHERATPSPRAVQASVGKPADWFGSVAIVTRTKNRPLLFERAARSVAKQLWKNYQWVVVNDGGETAAIRELIARSGVDPARITLIENRASVGMEAASNLGIRAVDTEFVVIHDDDDAWAPEFLSESIAFLQSPRAISADFDGVISRAWRVSEEIDGNQFIIIHGSEPYMPWVSEVPLAQMAVGNFFAPISFVYRRWVYDDIGGYDERLPVLGDWRFNLEFLARTNIGFLDRYLAYYHHRDQGTGTYVNSVVGARKLHGQYFSVVSNTLLRDPKIPDHVRLVIANAHQQRIIERNFASIREPLNRLAYPPQKDGPAPVAGKIAQQDVDHILKSLRAALPLTWSPRRFFARLRWEWRLARLDDPDLRRAELPKLLKLIPSPEDFDHLGYLAAHPEIWATRYNGVDESIPYHHFLTVGIDEGFARPNMTNVSQ